MEQLHLTPLPSPDALLVVDGELPSAELLQRLAELVPEVIATDGAVIRFGEATGRSPRATVGDGDSFTRDREAFLSSGMELVLLPDQESGDLEKALGWMEERGVRTVWLVGATGRNPDHAFNNLSVLARSSQRLRLILMSDHWWGEVLSAGAVNFTVPVGSRVSLLPTPRARLRTSGLRWELDDEVLEFGAREGASNETVAPDVQIDVLDGSLFLYVEVEPGLRRESVGR